MTRRDPSSNTGCVKWPTTTCKNTGEGGMAVYLVVPESAEETPDPFVACIPYTSVAVNMSYPDSLVSPQGEQVEELWPAAWDGESVSLLAAVCLGGSGGSWLDGEDLWRCTLDDLTDEGRAIHDALRALYGKDPIIVTVLDT